MRKYSHYGAISLSYANYGGIWATYDGISPPHANMLLFKILSNVIAEMVEFALELLGLEDIRELNDDEYVVVSIDNTFVRVKYKDITII